MGVLEWVSHRIKNSMVNGDSLSMIGSLLEWFLYKLRVSTNATLYQELWYVKL